MRSNYYSYLYFWGHKGLSDDFNIPRHSRSSAKITHPTKFLCNWTPSSKIICTFPVRTFHVTVKKTTKQKFTCYVKKNLFFWSRGMKQDKRKSWSLIEMPLKYRFFSLILFSAKILSIRTSHATHKKNRFNRHSRRKTKSNCFAILFFSSKRNPLFEMAKKVEVEENFASLCWHFFLVFLLGIVQLSCLIWGGGGLELFEARFC